MAWPDTGHPAIIFSYSKVYFEFIKPLTFHNSIINSKLLPPCAFSRRKFVASVYKDLAAYLAGYPAFLNNRISGASLTKSVKALGNCLLFCPHLAVGMVISSECIHLNISKATLKMYCKLAR